MMNKKRTCVLTEPIGKGADRSVARAVLACNGMATIGLLGGETTPGKGLPFHLDCDGRLHGRGPYAAILEFFKVGDAAHFGGLSKQLRHEIHAFAAAACDG